MPRVADVAYFNYRPGHSERWREGAACGPVMSKHPWHAVGRKSRPARELGKRICRELCPVREHCLAYALTARIEHGTWGGLDEDERARLPRATQVQIINKCRMTPYEGVESPPQEVPMVTVIAKVNFVSHLRPGDVGEIDDTLARMAVRNGYAELVGHVENFEGWMYRGETLRVSAKPHKADKPVKPRGRKRGPSSKSGKVDGPAAAGAAPTVAMSEEAS